LVRESAKPGRSTKKKVVKKTPQKSSDQSEEEKQQTALDLVLETVEDLFEERGEEEKVWGSMVKQALKRRKPGFSEAYHGFRTFSKLLEEAQTRKLLELEHDEKSGGYIIKSFAHDE
ncbi:MAG: OST-HTH/LOTUS domain-containing protein, partial [Gammaproteobacteria bacterium]|nr:OST-HTH/LOTUS domain-containing protein [Gammaproteobacteria bacterium]